MVGMGCHINPMLNLCHLILHSRPYITVSFIITQEWLGLLGDTPSPPSSTTPDTWVLDVGRNRNIPVASFYTMSATVFSIFHHYDLVSQHRHSPPGQIREGNIVDYVGVQTYSTSDE
ncbi:UDP-glycosyltransferase 87A1-like [Salvia splendens]|uniref:UDP-glycosyltransferase 87A1-like n=1 Tax=Salvia splendens TaxID=180675 RepID=UPI001C2633FA|nr:UDP-glycosyltransferase 87A1-like [Salvia splendens]